jgi:hypothetical protein
VVPKLVAMMGKIFTQSVDSDNWRFPSEFTFRGVDDWDLVAWSVDRR